ncbi:MAG TPA: hypothetical protein VF207_06460 [Chthoniobacterales bacterium]
MARASPSNRRRAKSRIHASVYTDLKDVAGPRLPGSGKSGNLRLLAWLSGTALVCAIGYLIALATRDKFDDSDPAKKTLELTDQDIDPETTLVEKSLLKQGQIDARLAIALWSDVKKQLNGDALRVAQQALQENKVVPILEPLAKQWANDFDAGKAAAFVIWVVEDESQKGNAVELQLNGMPLGKYTIEPSRYAITVVERSDLTSRLEIKGVSDSNGSIVFRAETATSEAETRHLSKGKSDFWQISVR